MPTTEANAPAQQLIELCWSHSRDAYLVADIQHGTIVEANPQAEKLTGYSRAELIGLPVVFIHPPSERPGATAQFQTAVHSAKLVTGFRILRKDGSLIPVEISTSEPFPLNGSLLSFAGIRDVSELQDQEKRLTVKRWALRAYAGAAMALTSSRSSATLMQEICEAITRDSTFILAWVGFAQSDPALPIQRQGYAGSAVRYLEGLELTWDESLESGRGVTGLAMRTNRVQVMRDSEAESYFAPWRLRAREVGIRSSMAAPFEIHDGQRGALMVYSTFPDAFGPVVVEAFTHLAEEIAIGLRAQEREEQLREEQAERERAQTQRAEALAAVVRSISTAMEVRDAYTFGHQNRVATIACAIAAEMGWPEDRMKALQIGAQVHDIGKISVPEDLLIKPGRLTREEWEIVKTHDDTGYAILKDVPFSWPVAEAVYQHHERLDGTGYPRGIRGEEITMEARIIAVADIVESMSSDRPYRAACGLDAALALLEAEAGSRLDAEVVRVCLRLFREKGFRLTPVGHPASSGSPR